VHGGDRRVALGCSDDEYVAQWAVSITAGPPCSRSPATRLAQPRSRRVSRTVTITGGSGFLASSCVGAGGGGLAGRFYDVRGPLIDLLRSRHMASATSPYARRAARGDSAPCKLAPSRRSCVRVSIRAREDDIPCARELSRAPLWGSER